MKNVQNFFFVRLAKGVARMILMTPVEELATNSNTSRGKFEVPTFLPEGETTNGHFPGNPVNLVTIWDRYVVVVLPV